jgi:hypothetical protein
LKAAPQREQVEIRVLAGANIIASHALDNAQQIRFESWLAYRRECAKQRGDDRRWRLRLVVGATTRRLTTLGISAISHFADLFPGGETPVLFGFRNT